MHISNFILQPDVINAIGHASNIPKVQIWNANHRITQCNHINSRNSKIMHCPLRCEMPYSCRSYNVENPIMTTAIHFFHYSHKLFGSSHGLHNIIFALLCINHSFFTGHKFFVLSLSLQIPFPHLQALPTSQITL